MNLDEKEKLYEVMRNLTGVAEILNALTFDDGLMIKEPLYVVSENIFYQRDAIKAILVDNGFFDAIPERSKI